MKKFNFSFLKLFFPVVLLGMLGIAACDPFNVEDYNESLGPMRMFMPSGAVTSISSVNNVRLSWKTPVNSLESNTTYTVEVAKDTLFATPVILTVQTDSSGVVLTDEQLEVQQRYYARVKANSTESRPESNWLYSSRFMIRGEQILLTPGSRDLTDNTAIIRWNNYPGQLTRIVLTPIGVEGATPIVVPLDDADRTAQLKIIEGLEPSTSYRVQIFQNNILRGFITIRTISSIAGVVIDLTDNPGPDALVEAIRTAPSHSTIILAKGTTYNMSSTIELDKSIRIMSELSTDPNLATILFTSNFALASGSNIDSVVFRDVHMMSDNYSSRYVFNINSSGTIGKVKFEGSHVEIFRGVMRLRSSVTINQFSIINSVVDSISNYGILTIDDAAATVRDILILNSTIYKVERPIVSKSASNSILISNSTFNETPESGRYLVDYAGLNVTNGIKVVNSIFGIGKALGASREGRGIRAGSGTLIESSGSYSTADRVVTSNPIPGLTVSPKTSFELFQAPKNGNFTIVDFTFPGRNSAGDPRWRP